MFLKTDQLDGETDWKLRKAIPLTQKREPLNMMFQDDYIEAMAPNDQIYDFKGKFIS